jgi:sec-independent protein translocase protein TatC
MISKKHTLELKGRFLYTILALLFAFGSALFFSNDLLYLLTRPLMGEGGDCNPSLSDRSLIFTHLTEAFVTHLWLSLYLSLIFVFPFLLLQIGLFLGPGLYPREKKRMGIFFVGSPLLFVLGLTVTYYILLPLTWHFLLAFESRGGETLVPLHLEAKISEYLSLSTSLFLGVGLLFQYPLLLLGLIDLKILQESNMIQLRKVFLLSSFFVAALLSPPDLFSQLLIVLPLLFFYEVALFVLLLKRAYSSKDKDHEDFLVERSRLL